MMEQPARRTTSWVTRRRSTHDSKDEDSLTAFTSEVTSEAISEVTSELEFKGDFLGGGTCITADVGQGTFFSYRLP